MRNVDALLFDRGRTFLLVDRDTLLLQDGGALLLGVGRAFLLVDRGASLAVHGGARLFVDDVALEAALGVGDTITEIGQGLDDGAGRVGP